MSPAFLRILFLFRVSTPRLRSGLAASYGVFSFDFAQDRLREFRIGPCSKDSQDLGKGGRGHSLDSPLVPLARNIASPDFTRPVLSEVEGITLMTRWEHG